MRAIPIEIQSEKDWQQIRRSAIGGSELAITAGISSYENHKTPYDLFLEKTGLVEPPPPTDPMKMGLLLEPVVACLYAEKTGFELVTCPLLRDPDEPLLVGTPDRLVKGQKRGVELKTASFRTAHLWGEEGSDSIPLEYICQSHAYLALTDYDYWDVAVLLGGESFAIYHLERDKELEDQLRECGIKFMKEHVLTNIPPPITGSERTKEYLAARYPTASAEMLPATAEADQWAQRLVTAKKQLDEAEEEKALAENNLKAIIQSAGGIKGETWTATWRMTKSGGVDWKAVAQSLHAPTTLIQQHTRPGHRRFLFDTDKE